MVLYKRATYVAYGEQWKRSIIFLVNIHQPNLVDVLFGDEGQLYYMVCAVVAYCLRRLMRVQNGQKYGL